MRSTLRRGLIRLTAAALVAMVGVEGSAFGQGRGQGGRDGGGQRSSAQSRPAARGGGQAQAGRASIVQQKQAARAVNGGTPRAASAPGGATARGRVMQAPRAPRSGGGPSAAPTRPSGPPRAAAAVPDRGARVTAARPAVRESPSVASQRAVARGQAPRNTSPVVVGSGSSRASGRILAIKKDARSNVAPSPSSPRVAQGDRSGARWADRGDRPGNRAGRSGDGDRASGGSRSFNSPRPGASSGGGRTGTWNHDHFGGQDRGGFARGGRDGGRSWSRGHDGGKFGHHGAHGGHAHKNSWKGSHSSSSIFIGIGATQGFGASWSVGWGWGSPWYRHRSVFVDPFFCPTPFVSYRPYFARSRFDPWCSWNDPFFTTCGLVPAVSVWSACPPTLAWSTPIYYGGTYGYGSVYGGSIATYPVTTVVGEPAVPMAAALPEPAAEAELLVTSDRELGDTYLRMDDPDNAIRVYQRHLEKHPGDVQAVRSLGIAMIASGQITEGVEQVRRAYRIDPALADRPLSTRLFSDEEAFARVLDLTMRLASNTGGAAAWLTVAVLMQADGRAGPAREAVERAEDGGLEQPISAAMRGVLPAAQ